MTAYYKTMQNASDAAVNMASSANGATVSISKIPKVSKAAELGLKALSIAGNMLMFLAITEGIQLAVKALDKLILTTEEAKEALDNSVSSFQGTTDELKNLESELETTSDRLRELQKLAENNSISIAEERELELLKQQNDELERKIALKKEEQVDAAKQVLKDAKKYSDKEVMSSYAYVSGTYEQGAPQYDSISAADELSIAFDKYYSSTNRPSANQQNPKDVIENMYAVIEPTIEAYEALIDADYKLSNEEQAHYDKLRSLQDRYLQYRYDLNGLKETYQALSIEQQKNILLNRLTAQGLSDIQANAVLDSVSESDYASLWEKGFSFTPPQMTDYATAEEYGKAYANAWLNGVKSGVGAANKTDISLSISDTVNQLNTKLKPAMDSLKSAYQSIFTEDGFTLDSVSSSMLSSIQDSILALNNLEGADIDIPIEDFEKFADVLTNVNTTEEQADDAFDNLATSIINGIGVTGQLSDETAGLVIQLLEEMGIVNANEVVTNALALQKERLAQASKISSETTYEHAVELVNEAGASEIAGMALAQLALEKIHVNGQTISTSDDIENIIALANAAGASAEALATLTQAKAILAGGDTYGRTQQDWASDVLSQINNGTYEYGFNLDADDFKVDFKGVGKDSASKAGKDAGEAYKEALEDELSDLDKIIGYIGDLFNDEIDALETAKDNAIDALEEAKEKELDALEKQKSALEKYKDALEDANKERELAMSLQKAQYELQRMLSQKTALIYSENKGFHYVQDTEGIRDKRNEVENIELDIKLHEIDEQIEDIDSEIEDVEEKYEKLISDTEAYYDAQINSLKLLQEQVEAITKAAENQEILALLEKYGINVNDILSGNEEALAKLKDRYLEVSKALSDYETTGAMDDLATSSDKASSSVSKVADATTQIDDEKVANLSSAMEGLGDTSNLDLLYNAFDQLKTIITEISDTLNGVDKEGGLVSALNELTKLSLGTTGKEATGLIGQFVALKDAIDAVTTAISGGAQGQNLPQGGAPTMQGAMTPSGSPDSAGTSGLTQAIEEQVNKAKELLPEEIDLFGADEESLLSAVTKVTTAIAGGGDSEGGEKKEQSGQREGEADTSHLIGALDAQYKEAEIKVPQEKDWFSELAAEIQKCVEALEDMVALLEEVGSDSGVDIKVGHAQGTVGKAFAKGTGKYKGLPSSEKNALRSEYGQPELTVYPDGTTELTTEPTMSDLPKDTVIFNEEQTRRIMKNKGTVLGNAHSEGTITLANGAILQPVNLGYDVDAVVQSLKNNMDYIINPLSSIDKNVDTIMRTTNNISNHNTSNVTTFSTGDIIVQGVQDVDGLAHAIKTRFPNAMIQAMSTTR